MVLSLKIYLIGIVIAFLPIIRSLKEGFISYKLSVIFLMIYISELGIIEFHDQRIEGFRYDHDFVPNF